MSVSGDVLKEDVCRRGRQCHSVDVILTDENTDVISLISDAPKCSPRCTRQRKDNRVYRGITSDTQTYSLPLHKKEETSLNRSDTGVRTMSSDEEFVMSSASVIMARHQNKKKKWYKKIGSKLKSSLSLSASHHNKTMSKSVENLRLAGDSVSVLESVTGARSMMELCRGQDTPPSSINGEDSDDGWADTESNCSSDLISLDSGILINRKTLVKYDDDSITEHDSVSQTLDFTGSSSIPSESLLGYSLGTLSKLYKHYSSDGTEDSEISDTDVGSDAGHKGPNYKRIPGKLSKRETNLTQRRQELMQHAFFHLDVWLKEGRDLVVRDNSGTSDPYVKFKVGNKSLYKSRTIFKNLNPKWDDKFTIPIEDVYKPLVVKCYDYDRGRSDDPMGATEIDLSTLELNTNKEMKLMLKDHKSNSEEYMGYILIQCTLSPKSVQEKELFQSRGSTLKKSVGSLESASKRLKMQIWSGVVTIVLVEGSDLMAMDDNGFSDPYVKFKLGPEKYKSKHKPKTLNPRWLEQFDLRIFDDQSKMLELTVYDHDISKDDFMGRATIDLSNIEKERTHVIEKQLEDGAGTIKLLLTISGTQGETISDLANFTVNPRDMDDIYRKYGPFNSLKNLRDIGWLQVKVFRAQGLMAADLGGKSDPFCVLELVNARLQTQTEYKTLNPEWNKVFTFNVKDIHSVLEITVYDEDRDKKVEFLGKIAIPLLQVKRGERRWYGLKDKKLLHRAKGAILLELDFIYNHVKAAIRTVNPKEEKYMQPDPKFKISVMKRNIERVSQLVSSVMEVGKFLQSCWAWESKPRSITAFCAFLVITWYFEPYMLPITLLILFLKNYITNSVTEAFSTDQRLESMYDDEDEDDDEEDREKDDKKSVREKFQAAQQVCLKVQEAMDMVACLGERIKNTFNWSVPWLSTLAVIALSVGAFILYYIPIRYLVMAWGINKFTKKLRAPNAIPNNELLDFLSRIPSDSDKIHFRYLRPDVPELSKKKQA